MRTRIEYNIRSEVRPVQNVSAHMSAQSSMVTAKNSPDSTHRTVSSWCKKTLFTEVPVNDGPTRPGRGVEDDEDHPDDQLGEERAQERW